MADIYTPGLSTAYIDEEIVNGVPETPVIVLVGDAVDTVILPRGDLTLIAELASSLLVYLAEHGVSPIVTDDEVTA